jgi:cholesterol oxidase
MFEAKVCKAVAVAVTLAGCAADVGDSSGVGAEHALLRRPTYADPNTVPAVVVGSGYGGSVAALRLAEKNVDTVVFERGRRWTPGVTTNTPFATLEGVDQNIGNPAPAPRPEADNSTWLNTRCVGNLYHSFLAAANPPVPVGCTRTTGILEVVDASPSTHRDATPMLQANGLSVIVAAGVGGGSLVNNGLTFPPTELAWNVAYPPDSTELPYMAKVWKDLNKTYFARAKGVLQPEVMPADLINDSHYRATKLTLDAVIAAGYPNVDTFDPNTLMGYAMMPVLVDWSKVREEISGARVPSIINGEVWWGNNSGARKSVDTTGSYLGRAEATGHVTVKPLHTVTDITYDEDDKLYVLTVLHTDESYQALETLTYKTPNLIMSAGSLGTTKLLVKARDTGKLPKLNAYVGTHFSNNGNMAHLRMTAETAEITQGGPGGLRVNDFREAGNPVVLENLPQRVPPLANFAPFREAILSIGIGIPKKNGTFHYDAASDTVVLDWPADAATDVYNRVTELYTALPGAQLYSGLSPQAVSTRNTLHPLGGMPLGLATNQHCKVKGYKHMYVVDGSVLPNSSAAANPSFLIASMAERCMNEIVKSVSGGDDGWEDDSHDDTNDD